MFLFASCMSGGDKEQKKVEEPVAKDALVKDLNIESPDSDKYGRYNHKAVSRDSRTP